jgi:hypothetical protein
MEEEEGKKKRAQVTLQLNNQSTGGQDPFRKQMSAKVVQVATKMLWAIIFFANVLMIGEMVYDTNNAGSQGSGTVLFSSNLLAMFMFVAQVFSIVYFGAVMNVGGPSPG